MKKIAFICLVMLVVLSGCKANVADVPDVVTGENNQTPSDVENKTEMTEQPVVEEELELFEEQYEAAEAIMKDLTTEEKIAQLMVVHSNDRAFNDSLKYNFGGVVFFAVEFKDKSKEQAIEHIERYNSTVKLKPMLCVDEEGGSVVRLSGIKALREEAFKSPRELLATGGVELVKQDAKEKVEFLKQFAINMNFAPVADISADKANYIYNRSAGDNAQIVGEFVEDVVEVMNGESFGSCVKHFPGYGDNLDTHHTGSYDTKTIEEFENSDLIPFQKGIDRGVPFVMVSHNIISCLDEENPASLSEDVMEYLREDMEFSGVVITDDLQMEAVKEFEDKYGVTTKALCAGNDMVITADYQNAIDGAVKALEDGVFTAQELDDKVRRVISYKLKYGIIK